MGVMKSSKFHKDWMMVWYGKTLGMRIDATSVAA